MDTPLQQPARVVSRVRKSLELGARKGGVRAHVRRALRRYYLDVVIRSLPPDTVPPGTLRRNLILHGSDCTYGTPATSWKTLILFDTIVESLHVALIEGDDGLYHLPTCERCLNVPDEAQRYVHASRSGELAERSPCEERDAPELDSDLRAVKREPRRATTRSRSLLGCGDRETPTFCRPPEVDSAQRGARRGEPTSGSRLL
jgi:hypothetical protein